MYGFQSQEFAEAQAAQLRSRNDGNRYEVAPHRVSVTGFSLTWGVKRYVPYCAVMPERFDGFVWFTGVL